MATIEEQILNEMYEWYGLKLTEEQVKDIVDNVDLSYGAVDTVERDNIIDYIGRKLTGMPWPMNGDSHEHKKKFYTELEKNSNKLGYKFKTFK